jgi:hypothetical protein
VPSFPLLAVLFLFLTSALELNNIHVYYQDEDYVLREVISTGNKPYKW